MSRPLVLDIKDLVIAPVAGGRNVVDHISLSVRQGEIVALIGESGSGKTTLSLAALGHIRPGLAVRGGHVGFGDTDMLATGGGMLRDLRGRRVTYVAQSAAAAFNARMRLDTQVTEPARVHHTRPAQDALARARLLYRRLNLPNPDRIGTRYPHEVSGGQLQRFMAAMGLLEEPALVVFDEPTSALDVTTQVEVLQAFKGAVRNGKTSALFVSHDLAVVAQMADRILVLRGGRLVEQGSVEEILHAPKEDYTRELIGACKRWMKGETSKPTAPPPGAPVLEVKGITAGFGARGADGLPAVVAVRDASFSVHRGEVVAVIGESGSGKTTLAHVIAGLHAPAAGRIDVDGTALAATVAQRSREERRRVQMVFQMADTALNPRHTVERILGRVLTYFWGMRGAARDARIKDLLDLVRLPPHYAQRRSTQLSGGEKQRVNLARALAAKPDVLVCDEITSALDTVVASAMLRLVDDLRGRLGMAVVFISHDLATVATLAGRILVMRHGEVVEQGFAGTVLSRPTHAYTRLLVDSVPELRVGWLEEAAQRNAAAIAALGSSQGDIRSK
ncbi:MAG: ABC transporter ATP-binding protein [Alphaproteobacteria bacterium]